MMLLKKDSGLLSVQAVAITLALCSGCSQIKDAQDKMNTMADTTTQVAKTSDDLDTKTTTIKEDSDNLKKDTHDVLGLTTDMDQETNSLYIKERQGAALEVRKDMLNQMNKATTMEAKISFAGAYFMAYEYQLWGGSKEDDQARLEGLYNCALQEFFREATLYMPEDYKYNSKVDPTSKNNKDMNMYALAVTMHMKNSYEINQLIDPTNTDAKPNLVSMYDLLQNGLHKRLDRDSGKIKESDLKDWQKEVLNDEQAFEYMIHVRENFLPVMTLAQVSKIGLKGATILPGILHVGDIRGLLMLMRPWTADIKSLNTEQLITFTKWINDPEGALGARGVLHDLGVDYSMNDKVSKIYRNMQFDDAGIPAADKIAESENIPSPLDNFKQAVADLLRGN